MRSTFYGIEAAKSGMTAAQTGLDITANNIANQSTQGYTRQLVQQSASYHNADSYRIAPKGSMNYSLGVDIDGIGQARDQFLDLRYRNANAEDSGTTKMLSILQDMENNIDETENDGLSVMLDDLYAQLSTLSQNAGEVEYSSLVRLSAQKVTQTINQYASQMESIRSQEMENIDVAVMDVNTLLGKIDTVNESIKNAKLQNNSTNELSDMRNLYLDQLSSYMDISVTNHDDGTLSVKAGGEYLVDAQNHTVASFTVVDDPNNVRFQADGTDLSIKAGSLYGEMQVLNGLGSYAGSGENGFRGIPYYLKSLDSLTNSFADTFNSLNGSGKPLFSGSTASTIAISDQWLNNANYITATTDSDPAAGKNDNILRMIAAMDEDRAVSSGFTGSFSDFTLSMMSDLAIDVSYTKDVSETNGTVVTAIKNQRESVMGVSINEETVNLLKYQRAFEASSRVLTALDDALDTLINRTGMVGR